MFRARHVAHHFASVARGDSTGGIQGRAIQSTKERNMDPFVAMDEFTVGLPNGFPDHPHRGFETVTYLLPRSKGHMLHEDFLGNKGELRPGDLQWMTPGRGIVHAEMPATADVGHGLQLWVNLPKALKMIEPRYQEIKRETVPRVFNDDKTVEAILFSGEAFGKKGPIETQAPMTYIHFIMKKNAKIEFAVPKGHTTVLYALVGDGKIADKKVTVYDAILFEVEGDGIEVEAVEAFEFIVLSGQPLNEPVVQHGPFVMNTKQEIRDSLTDFYEGKNGFENAPNWESDLSRRRFK